MNKGKSNKEEKVKKWRIFRLFPILPISIFLTELISFLFKASDPALANGTCTITKIFMALILIGFLVGMLQLRLKWPELAGFAGSISSHLPALGILGTFVGIFVGLYKFNVNNLYTSVPLLLDGMKLAFSTSIAGLMTSTILRVSHSIVVSITEERDPFIQKPKKDEVQAPTKYVYIYDEILSNLVKMSDSEFNSKLNRIRDCNLKNYFSPKNSNILARKSG